MSERGTAPMKARIISDLGVVTSYRVEVGKYSLFIILMNVLLLEHNPLVTRFFMADIKTVQLIVNSEQAKSKIAEFNKQLDVAKKKKMDAFNAGDAKGIEVYSKEIKKLKNQLKNAQTRGETIAKTLKNQDKATPNELKATIRN